MGLWIDGFRMLVAVLPLLGVGAYGAASQSLSADENSSRRGERNRSSPVRPARGGRQVVEIGPDDPNAIEANSSPRVTTAINRP